MPGLENVCSILPIIFVRMQICILGPFSHTRNLYLEFRLCAQYEPFSYHIEYWIHFFGIIGFCSVRFTSVGELFVMYNITT